MADAQSVPPFAPEFVRAVCDVLAQTDWPGLSNTEIDQLLSQLRLGARDTSLNKRSSLFYALFNAQVPNQTGQPVLRFINAAMAPIRYTGDPKRFEELRAQLNEVMIFHSLSVSEKGRLTRASSGASTVSEGAKLAGRLHAELRHRGAHHLLFRYCNEELVTRSLFHGLSEAAKSIPDRVRETTGLAGDGSALYDQVFGTNTQRPKLFINGFVTDSDISEHRGFKNLLLGVHGHYRNPRAHSPRINADERVEDFYDAMSLFSYIHRRLDTASTDPSEAL